MALYLAMIPINLKKVLQIRKLITAVEHAKSDAPVGGWLLPRMTRREAKAGETLWRIGDVATEMVYVEAAVCAWSNRIRGWVGLRRLHHGTSFLQQQAAARPP